jgi:hypothetical protein
MYPIAQISLRLLEENIFFSPRTPQHRGPVQIALGLGHPTGEEDPEQQRKEKQR